MSVLKDYREKQLAYYVLVLCSGYLFFNSGLLSNFQALSSLFGFLVSASIPIIVVQTFVQLFDGLIGRNTKQNIISLFGLYSMPGQTIFSDMHKGKIDQRLDALQVQSAYEQILEELPTNRRIRKEFENQQWYKIYRQHEDEERISSYNKEYLLYRDMFCQTMEVILLYIVFVLLGLITFTMHYLIFLSVFGILSFIGCRVKAKDFVYIVIVVDVSSSY